MFGFTEQEQLQINSVRAQIYLRRKEGISDEAILSELATQKMSPEVIAQGMAEADSIKVREGIALATKAVGIATMGAGAYYSFRHFQKNRSFSGPLAGMFFLGTMLWFSKAARKPEV